MPHARTMPDAVLLPTGEVLIVNGAGTGISGYGNVVDQVGASNADDPVLTPVLYDPAARAGERFSTGGMPTSDIPRLYHSVATLTPNADVMIAGSNPNLDRSEVKYGTEYRVEWLGPAYLKRERPQIVSEIPRLLGFGQTLQMKIRLPAASLQGANVKGASLLSHVLSDIEHELNIFIVALMDLGYVTHAVHANSRMVYLVSSLSDDKTTLTITGPPNGNIYPPGPGFIYVVADGVPSTGRKLLVGEGRSPAVDYPALEK